VAIWHPADNWAAMANARLSLINSGHPMWAARLIHNKLTFIGDVFSRNYLSYFSPQFLFVSGAAEATYGMLPGFGVLYLIQLPLLLIFIYQLFKTQNKNYYYLLLLLLISPIAASLSKGPGFAANRSAFMVIPLTLISSIGAGFMAQKMNKLFSLLLLLLLLLSTVSFFKTYILKSPLIHSRSMGYGWQPVVRFLQTSASNYSQIRVSRSLSEPHIYMAFYGAVSPRFYQQSSQRWPDFAKQGYKFLDQYDGYTMGRLRFGDLDYNQTVKTPTLYVGRPSDFPPETTPLLVSSYPDNSPAIVVVEKNHLHFRPAGNSVGPNGRN
jgi:hypothetical protein